MRFHSAACRFNGHSERPFQPCHGSVFKSSSCCQGKSFQGIRQSLIDRASILCSKGVDYLQSKPYLLWTCCASSCSTQRGCLLYWACNQNHWRPRRPPECCGFTPPPKDFLPMPPFTNRLEDLTPAAGDLRSRSRASLQKIVGQSLLVGNTQSNSNLALRLEAKNAPDICRAFSVCLRCCLVDFTLALTGTGFPSVRSFRACNTIVKKGLTMEMWCRHTVTTKQTMHLGLAADFFFLGFCCSLCMHASDAIF